MSYISAPKDLFDIIFQLQLNGYIPVIAHPERYRFYFDNSKDLKKLKLLGCKFQLNLFSTTDYYGKDVRIFTEYLINNQMYAFVGSDIHKLSQIKNFSIRLKINNVKELKKLIDNTIETFS